MGWCIGLHDTAGEENKMRRRQGWMWLILAGCGVAIGGAVGWQPGFLADAHEPHVTNRIGDRPALSGHIDQRAINSGRLRFQELFDAGELLFRANFNTLDGGGRPEATGSGVPFPRERRVFPQNFNRSSGPDASSCDGCHNQPRVGGGGENVTSVFVLAQNREFITSIDPSVANERNTLGMFGSGAIEMLAREMSRDLRRLREQTLAKARRAKHAVSVSLDTKGVNFGRLTASPDETVDTSQIVGVNIDLIIRPFNQKGSVVSIRVFTNNAMNHHHGMEAVERFGDGIDFDKDGVVDELSRGDITAVTIFQAAQAIPGQRIPTDEEVARAILIGEERFGAIGCAACHVPAMVLEDPSFSEPNPFNNGEPSPLNTGGNLSLLDVGFRPVTFDLTRDGPLPRLDRTPEGKAIVRAFTDLKRHRMGAKLTERLVQDRVSVDVFITKKLWGFANDPPYLHNGRATLISEAILMHGGEAQAARDAFAALSVEEQAELVEFLKSLVVLPEGTPSLVVDEHNGPVDKDQLRRQLGL